MCSLVTNIPAIQSPRRLRGMCMRARSAQTRATYIAPNVTTSTVTTVGPSVDLPATVFIQESPLRY